jgi:hypothetical protein
VRVWRHVPDCQRHPPERKRLARGDAAPPANAEMAPGAKGMEEGKAVSTNAVNHVIDLAWTYLFPNVERACRPAVDGKIENAQIFPRTQEVAIDVIPIFLAIDFIALGGFDREDIPASELSTALVIAGRGFLVMSQTTPALKRFRPALNKGEPGAGM